MFEARFTNIRCKITQDSYISESKCWKLEKPIVNNGRIQSADYYAVRLQMLTLKLLNRFMNGIQWRLLMFIGFTRGICRRQLLIA